MEWISVEERLPEDDLPPNSDRVAIGVSWCYAPVAVEQRCDWCHPLDAAPAAAGGEMNV